MKAGDILKQVLQTLESRGKENGYDQKEERSADSIADIFNAISDKEFAAADVWKHMIALKLARLKSQIINGSDVTDSIVDLIGYAALLGEELTKEPDAVEYVVYRPDAVAEVDYGGWVSWSGGTCPVKDGTLVDVEYRDGVRGYALPASKLSNNCDSSLERSARKEFWEHDDIASDIVMYRLAKDLADEENTDDGWFDWAGGECPVPSGTLVDVEYRDGARGFSLRADKTDAETSRDAGSAFWMNDGRDNDIVKYRVI